MYNVNHNLSTVLQLIQGQSFTHHGQVN